MLNGRVSLESFAQPSNALPPMRSTPLPRSRVSSDLQLENAQLSISVTESGMVSEAMLEQYVKALGAIFFKFFDRVTWVSDEQEEKEKPSISVIPLSFTWARMSFTIWAPSLVLPA